MVAFLAEQAAQSDKWWAVPTGVVLGALVTAGLGGVFGWWNAKRPKELTSHEKLKLLVEVIDKWPQENPPPGIDTLHQAIEAALADVRRDDKLAGAPAPPSSIRQSSAAELKFTAYFDDLAKLKGRTAYLAEAFETLLCWFAGIVVSVVALFFVPADSLWEAPVWGAAAVVLSFMFHLFRRPTTRWAERVVEAQTARPEGHPLNWLMGR
ncbi:hypothetical protein [Nocardia sp. NPDC004860]|uniref:hypothetical protein n=1 Tax=Nocardia sp. NPDC004860 TaxID=3154557 RepID=UPI0033BC139A